MSLATAKYVTEFNVNKQEVACAGEIDTAEVWVEGGLNTGVNHAHCHSTYSNLLFRISVIVSIK